MSGPDPSDFSDYPDPSYNPWTDPSFLFSKAVSLAITVFTLWMLVHALMNRRWLWALAIVALPIFATMYYFFTVYQVSEGSGTGFELPGSFDRRRIKKLQADIYHLDKAHHYLALADIYFSQGKFQLAEENYLAAEQRDSKDLDIRSHLGQCLLRQKRGAEALPWLEGVVKENARHEYGYTLMALAEATAELGRKEEAIALWRQVLTMYSYSRAQVQLAELIKEKGDIAGARKLLNEVLQANEHFTRAQRSRDKVWQRRAKKVMKTLPAEARGGTMTA